jgi:dihydrofolate reductase
MKTFIIAAISADGFIGQHEGHNSIDWTSPEDKKLFVRLTKEAGIMVMGSRTFQTIGRALPGRRTIVLTNHPETITAEGIEASSETPQQLVSRLHTEGMQALAICGGANVYAQFMQAGLVNELYLTIEPVVFGTGVPLFASKLATQLQLLEHTPLNDNAVLLHYKVV